MGGAASRDFIENQKAKSTIAQELDELGGYDRPALAKNQSFSARLDWLGNQVGKASNQIEAALSKDEQAGRKELEKEAKRRQLMALRRGQGDVRLNLQYADFFLTHKQFERPPVSGSGNSILKPGGSQGSITHGSAPGHGVLFSPDTVDHQDAPSSPKTEAAKRSAEKVATLTRVYSGRHSGASFTSQGTANSGGSSGPASGSHALPDSHPAPPPTSAGNKWRQTVMHAKRTAFLAVNTANALMGGKRRGGPGRIDNFAIYAEHQLGENMTRFAEESNKVAAAREKLPQMKTELEQLREQMRQLALEQQKAMEAGGDDDDEEVVEPEEDPDTVAADEAAAVAAAAAMNMRQQRQSQNGRFWNYGSKGDGTFGPPPPVARKQAKLKDHPAASGPSNSSSNAAGPGSGAFALAPSPLGGPLGLPDMTGGPPSGRRRVSTGSPGTLVTQSINGPVSSLLSNVHGPGHAGTSLAGPPGPGGLGILAGPGLGRTSGARASWSGSGPESLVAAAAAAAAATGAARGAAEAGSLLGPLGSAPLAGHSSVGPLRPLRGGGFGLSARVSTSVPGSRSQSDPNTSLGAAAAAAVAAATGSGRPASGVRGSMTARPPSSRPGTVANRLREANRLDSPRNSGEYRLGTMAERVKSKTGDLKMRKAAARVALRELRDEETANVLKQQSLVQAIEEAQGIISTSSGLLQMYCNRANGRWVEAQGWALPYVHEMVMPAVRRQVERYKEVVMKDLRAGKLAVQIHVDDDVLHSSRLGPVSLWGADPWALLALTHPARTEATGHLVGLGLGVRQLLALATAVEAMAGHEALMRFPVVIACHEGQVDAVVKDLSSRRLCRFHPDNLIVIVQQRAPGHTFDRERRSFVVAREAPLRPAGSGYALLALGWAGSDAFRLGGPDFTERRPLSQSSLDIFTERGVEWLSSWRLRDLVHYSPESCLNIDQLAYSYALQDSVDANMTMQVELMDGMQGASRCGSGIVLALKERAKPTVTTSAALSSTVALLRRPGGAGAADSNTSPATSGIGTPHSNASPASSGGGAGSVYSGGSGGSAASSPAESGSFTSRFNPGYQPHGASPLGPGGGGTAAPQSMMSPTPPSSAAPSRGLGQQSPHRMQSHRHHSGSNSGSAPSSPKPASAPPAVSGSGAARRTRAGGIGTEGGPLGACDVKWCDVQTPALATGLQQLIDQATIQTGTQPRLAIAIKRYVFHVPSLKGMLTSPSIFRPAVVVGEGGFLYVTFDASDITALPGARCVSISYTPRTGGSSTDAPAGTAPPAAGSPSTSGGGAPPAASAAAGSANAAGGGNGNALPHLLPRKSASGNTPSVPSTGGLLMPGSNPAVVTVAAAAAAAALQRGRLLTNDADLDTLLYVVADQDASPLFRASVSATNTAKSRVVAHAPGGIAAAGPTPGGARGLKLPPPKNVIVVAVADDASCPLAVRVAMGVMKPGADCIHLLAIAKDGSHTVMQTLKALTERFETMASVTLGDVKSIVQVKRKSIVEDICAYAESQNAVLLITGSMSLAAPQGSSVVGSVALSVARESAVPVIVVKPTARLVESAYEVGKKPCLRCLVGAEPSSRPLVRFMVGKVMDGGRGDKLVLVRGKAFDKDMQELTSSRRILDHLVDEAVSNRRFDASLIVRRMVPGSFDAEYPRVADADQCHIVGVQVPEGRGPLPASVIAMLRSSRSAVLLYRATSGAPGVVAANRSALEQAEAEAAAAEAAAGKGASEGGEAAAK
ncbi:hypothetical protein CHLRE_10g449700v5 [Chlamydomonas reinhardtii]|uniref:UspA domain-containing protein n=1 Tax=Chlamydomonas reinhardtii TaxID=3055 RepID=A0A2K3DB40_CHLRE|nr:uncharacterized protein CHLRE_10g449700v5 [Chlamydomonas reinhardtii]PNW77742.1 hypothetical protein CHLRE_10g449700v5 [Chlamydomonas reinhardtii]